MWEKLPMVQLEFNQKIGKMGKENPKPLFHNGKGPEKFSAGRIGRAWDQRLFIHGSADMNTSPSRDQSCVIYGVLFRGSVQSDTPLKIFTAQKKPPPVPFRRF
jgi:hypothetical protein